MISHISYCVWILLAPLSVAYYYRKNFFPDIWEKHRQLEIESHQQASQFREIIKEGVKKEKEQKQKG